jgi:hypothetical protein
MDFVERVFHVSPDRGDGTFELVLLLLVAAIILVRFWRRRRGRAWQDPADRM